MLRILAQPGRKNADSALFFASGPLSAGYLETISSFSTTAFNTLGFGMHRSDVQPHLMAAMGALSRSRNFALKNSHILQWSSSQRVNNIIIG